MKVLAALFSLLISVGSCSGDVPGNIECGRTYPREERNSDGAIARSNDRPWLVALFHRVGQTDFFACGGALITQKYILTAAHCVDFPWYKMLLGEIVAKLGMHNQNSTASRDVQRIRKTIIHEHYVLSWLDSEKLNLTNDIALLELAEPVIFSPHIVPICLPKYEENFAGVSAYFYGWGSNSTRNTQASLHRTKFLVVPHGAMDASGRTHIPITTFYALHQEGTAMCKGDSGSPMISEVDERATIIGIASWGTDSCVSGPNSLSASTNVSNYVSWIEANINKPQSIADISVYVRAVVNTFSKLMLTGYVWTNL